MNVTIVPGIAPKPMKGSDLPLGSIAKVKDMNQTIYVIRTKDNGDKYIVIWPNATPVGIEARKDSIVDDWEVEKLPEGTTFTLTF